MEFTVDDKEVRESTGETDYKAAQLVMQRRLGEIAAGTYVGPDREKITIATLLDGLLDYYSTRKLRSLPSVTAQVKPLRAALGPLKARDLTTVRLRRLVKSWQDTGTITDATINRRLSLLRRAYSLGKLVPDPARLDFADLFLVENSPLGKHIDAPAFAAICAALPAILLAFFEFCYLCGTRKGQLARTTWAHWNPHTKEFTWSAAEVKAKRPTVLPLDGRALAIIETLYRTRSLACPYVFHGRRCGLGHQPSRDYGCVGNFRKAWATACKQAGFPVGRRAGGYVFHNTRHTAVTNLVNAGVPAHEAMTVSGHRTRSVFDRYSLSLKAQTRAALRAVDSYTQQQDTTPTVVPVRRPPA
jgi:integrase